MSKRRVLLWLAVMWALSSSGFLTACTKSATTPVVAPSQSDPPIAPDSRPSEASSSPPESGPPTRSEQILQTPEQSKSLQGLAFTSVNVAPLSDGSLYVAGTTNDRTGGLLYFDAQTGELTTLQKSTFHDGTISEVAADGRSLVWSDVSAAGEWTLFFQKGLEGHPQPVAGTTVGETHRVNGPLAPEVMGDRVVFMEPGRDQATDVVGYDVSGHQLIRFTDSGQAVLPMLTADGVLYGEVGSAFVGYWLVSWDRQTKRQVIDYDANPPALAYPYTVVPVYGASRFVKLVNLETGHEEVLSPPQLRGDLIVAISADYALWFNTVENMFHVRDLHGDQTYRVLPPKGISMMRPRLADKTLVYQGVRGGHVEVFELRLP